MIKILALAGASASGKSFVAKALLDFLNNKYGEDAAVVIGEDSYYQDHPELEIEQRAKLNYDHPDAFEHSLLFEHLKKLKMGKAIEEPQYCYKTHARKNQTLTINPQKWIIIEGMHLFYRKQIKKILDVKIYVETPLEVCLARRIVRDQQQRNRTLESINLQFENSVKPMFLKFIKPEKNAADFIIDGTKNINELLKTITNKLK